MSDNIRKQEQTQTQTQFQVLQLNLRNSGDPELESQIFGGLYSVGRQIGRINAVLEALLAHAPAGAFSSNEATAIQAFRVMLRDIDAAKRARQNVIVEQLELLRKSDAQAFADALSAVRAYLNRVGTPEQG